MPPQKAPNYGAADAKAYKPICYQNSGNKTSLYWKLLPEYLNRDPESEDCLYLNIWAPKRPVEKKVPVIIWVSGGGFKEGGGHALYQVPDQWVQRMQTHIVVTFKYASSHSERDTDVILIYFQLPPPYLRFPGLACCAYQCRLIGSQTCVWRFPQYLLILQITNFFGDSVEWVKDNIGGFG